MGWQEILTPDREDSKQLPYVSPILSSADPIVGQTIENPYISCDCPERDHSARKCCVPSKSTASYRMAQGSSRSCTRVIS